MATKSETIELIAAAIATRRGMRRGVPMISNVLDVLPDKIKEDIMDDAEGVFDELQKEYDVRFGEIVDLATEGLSNDGAHHKQYFLEKIISKAGYSVDEIRDQEKQDGNYIGDPGIAP